MGSNPAAPIFDRLIDRHAPAIPVTVNARLVTRILSSLYALAALLMVYATAVLFVLPAKGAPFSLPSLVTVAVVLTAIYASAAWTMWRRTDWKLALLLCGLSIFGWPVGTLLAVISLVVLMLPEVRGSFAR